MGSKGMRYSRSALFTLGVLFPVLAFTAESLDQVEAWLQKMQRAAHTLNYEGTFVYGHGSNLTSMRIIHRADSEGEQERLIALDGSGREVVRSKDTVTCIMPDTRSIVVEPTRPNKQFPPVFPMRVAHLADIYAFRLIDGQSMVAGRPTQRIEILPRDHYRYGHRLWIDRETGLLLKTHLLNEQGRPVEQFMFTRIRFLEHVPDELLAPDINAAGFTRYEVNHEAMDADADAPPAVIVGWLPPGFREDMQRLQRLPTSVKPVEHLVFSDGLASVSVFLEEELEQDAANLIGGTRMGAVNVHGRSLGDYHVTVVGEVPHRTVERISTSVRIPSDHD